jgi:hypothetical protein
MKRSLVLLLVASLLANLGLLYRIVDMGLTSTYAGDEIARREKQEADAQQLLRVLLATTSRDDLLDAAHRASLEVINKGEEGVYVGEIRFVFSGDRVVGVDFD